MKPKDTTKEDVNGRHEYRQDDNGYCLVCGKEAHFCTGKITPTTDTTLLEGDNDDKRKR